MKRIRIGLFGAIINNDNMGCCALTFSLIRLLENIVDERDCNVEYVIFERWPDEKKIEELCELLAISKNKVSSAKSIRFSKIYRLDQFKEFLKEIEKCDYAIDITQGDSFTDIYGIKRFFAFSFDKLMVQHKKVPLILGPQTYGPFQKGISKKIARRIINHSHCVFSRDNYSIEYLEKQLKIKKSMIQVTDLAFGLPYHDTVRFQGKNVGLNVSGLLWPQKTESTVTAFSLACDYKQFIFDTVSYLENEGYCIHLISHVGADMSACEQVHKEYPNTILVPEFENPILAKSYISAMDLFIGARMHATIAALSSFVPVIPVSYSRKFQGLFQSIGYPICLDVLNWDTKCAVDYLKLQVESIDELKQAVVLAKKRSEEEYQTMATKIADCIMDKVSIDFRDEEE